MRKPILRTVALGALIMVPLAQAAIKKVTLFVNYGEGAILHPGAVDPFKNTLNALKTEKGFELTISEQTNTAAQKAAAISNLKTQDVILFANIGLNSFQKVADQAAIEAYFTGGGKGIGFHASIDHHMYWKWWSDLHSGGTFQGHGSNPFKLTLDPEIKKIPTLQKMWEVNNLGDPNISQTEIYTLTAYPRGKEGVTMMQTVAPPNNAIPVHDFTWHKKTGQGEYIFTCLGHGPGDFTGGWLQKATWAWMEYLNGKYDPVTLVNGKPKLAANTVVFDGTSLDMDFGKGYAMTLVDAAGKSIMSGTADGYRSYSMTGIRSGLYFLKVKAKSGSSTRSLIVP